MFEDAITLRFVQEENRFSRNYSSKIKKRSVCKKFERWISSRDHGERLCRRACRDRKVGLYFALEIVEVRFQYRRFVGVGNRTQMEFPPRASLLQRDLSGGFGISNPLRSSTRRDEICHAVQFQQIDWSGVELAGFSSADFGRELEGKAKPKANRKSKKGVEVLSNAGGFGEGGGGI